jgi:hypothetical protein
LGFKEHDYYCAVDGRIASDGGGYLYWLLGDDLGSTSVVLVEGEYSNC